ncbi:MAG: hypothetical protein ABR612_01830 [Chromatocurvus sp.]
MSAGRPLPGTGHPRAAAATRCKVGSLRALCLGVSAFFLAACTQTTQERSEPSAAAPVDFSGHWELNFAQSDNVQAQMGALVRNLRKQAERQAAMRSERGGRGGPGVVLGGGGTDSAPSIIGLARMAEMITESQLFEVEQSRTRIQVKREGNFALTCDFLRQATSVRDLGVGREACGWDGSQLVFRIALPEGLSIRHRFSLAPSGDQLGVYTTVFSDRVSSPFSVQRVYNRFEPGERGYSCEMTVTRGRVCTTESK